MSKTYTEDTLVQHTTAEYLRDALGWETVHGYKETYGTTGTLGRTSDREVILTRYLLPTLTRLNPGLPETAYEEAARRIADYNMASSMVAINRDNYELLRDGVLVSVRDAAGDLVHERLRVFDFQNPDANHFLAVREFWIRGDLYRRRADIVGFVNGIPLLFMELKNVHRDPEAAYNENYSDYLTTVPRLFHHNALVVLSNGIRARVGAVTNTYKQFHEWKRLDEDSPGEVDFETLLKGVCDRARLLDLVESFILFDDSTGTLRKILAHNHQYLGVNRAVQAVRERKERTGKLGVFWHTQGSGKSYSMVFFTRKVHRTISGAFSFLIATDRDDLDTQIYRTFAGCGVVDNDREQCRPGDSKTLQRMLGEHPAYIFTLVQKFHQEVNPDTPWSSRDDIIVISDEAHRTQYGRLALNMRNALPEASYIGFTGTPLFKGDELTRRVFGNYISTYDFQRAVSDGATVPLYYDARGEHLGLATTELNERIAEKLEELEIEDLDTAARLERELKRDYHIITASKRLDAIARDFVEHYSTAWESGKAMLVSIDKITCVRMYNLIDKYWRERIDFLEKSLQSLDDDQEELYRRRQIAWMKETRIAVVVSEEQGEQEKFRKAELDITPHRRLMKEGFETPDGRRIDVEEAFKKDDHPFRIVIVCAMWLTGFDVPSLANLYLDKPLKAHTLMQAIARANRVHKEKTNGLIIDYCGILKNLRAALATFASRYDAGNGTGVDEDTDPEKGLSLQPAEPAEELIERLAEAITMVRAFFEERGIRLEDISKLRGFAQIGAIARAKEAAKEAVNENDESRKRFEIMAREVFRRFKACITLPAVNDHRAAHDAINIIYRSLQADRENADITAIINELHRITDEAIEIRPITGIAEPPRPYDISRIDFERLRQEFARSPRKNSTVQELKSVIERKLTRMIDQNPLRTDFQGHYEQIIEEYNREKNRVTIEQTFEELWKFYENLTEEEQRAAREGLNEETLAIYDLLAKPELSNGELARVKKVATELLAQLKEKVLSRENWQVKESTRAAVRMEIEDFLWADTTGLSAEYYSMEEVRRRAAAVYMHVARMYRRGRQSYIM